MHRAWPPPPSADDKLLTDLNGQAVSAFVAAYRVSGELRYLTATESAPSFVVNKLIAADGTLFHRYRDGEAAIAGFLDDYAHFCRGLCDLFMVTGEPQYLSRALSLARQIPGLFGDSVAAGLFSAISSDDEIVRLKAWVDEPGRSGNAATASPPR